MHHRRLWLVWADDCRQALQRNHDVAAAARGLSEHYPTVGIQELPHGGGWIIGGGAGRRVISSQNCRSGRLNTCSASGFASGPPSF